MYFVRAFSLQRSFVMLKHNYLYVKLYIGMFTLDSGHNIVSCTLYTHYTITHLALSVLCQGLLSCLAKKVRSVYSHTSTVSVIIW